MIRLFAALEIPKDVGRDLEQLQQGIPGARWRPLDTLHLTLRFYGEVDEATAADLDTELGHIAGEPFDFTLEGVGAFGEGDEVRAIWAGVADNPVLTKLAARCETAAKRVGLKSEGRAWRPHVTLAYLKRPDPSRVAAWIQSHNLLQSPSIRATWFGLYSSWRTAETSRYDLEREYPLL